MLEVVMLITKSELTARYTWHLSILTSPTAIPFPLPAVFPLALLLAILFPIPVNLFPEKRFVVDSSVEVVVAEEPNVGGGSDVVAL